MRSGQFNNRRPRNAVGAGKRSSGNEFNTSRKRERRPEPSEFPTKEVKEWEQFPEMRDARPTQFEDLSLSSSSESRSSSRSIKQMRKAARNVVRNTVVMVAGTTTVLANTVMPELKTAIAEAFYPEPPAVVETVNPVPAAEADWLHEDTPPNSAPAGEGAAGSSRGTTGGSQGTTGGDTGMFDSESQSVAPSAPETPVESEAAEEPETPTEPEVSEEPEEPKEPEEPEKPEEPKEPEEPEEPETPKKPEPSSGGDAASPKWSWTDDKRSATLWLPGVGNVEAEVSIVEVPAGCTAAGTRTCTATAEAGGRIYTETRSETIPATGHSFGSPSTTTDGDGNAVIRYHCDGCDQDFEIGYGVTIEA